MIKFISIFLQIFLVILIISITYQIYHRIKNLKKTDIYIKISDAKIELIEKPEIKKEVKQMIKDFYDHD